MSRVEPETPTGPSRPSLQSGAALGRYLRLEEPLPFLPDQRLWRATDLRTRTVHAVEYLGPAAADTAQMLAARSRTVAPAHPNLQPFYRCETIEGSLYAVGGYDERLAQPNGLNATDEAWRDLAVTKAWLRALFSAGSALRRQDLLAHGAIVPSRIAGSPATGPLLTGYPCATALFGPLDRAFLSPSQRPTPEPRGDAYSLAALAFWLLSLGQEPSVSAAESIGMGRINAARSEKNAPPIVWPEGAEFALLSALQQDGAQPPQDAVLLFANLEPFLNPAESTRVISAPAIAPRARVTPPWRAQQLRRRHERLRRLSGEGSSTETPALSGELLAQNKKLQSELLRAEADLTRRETLLSRERDAFSLQSSALVEQQADLQRQQSGLAAQRTAIEAAQRAAHQQEEERQARERELQKGRDLLRQEEEKQANLRDALLQEQKILAAEQAQTRAGIDKLTTQQSGLAEKERGLASAREEIARREQALGVIQQELTKITGTSDVRQWDFFVQQLRANKAEQERRAAALAKAEDQSTVQQRELKGESAKGSAAEVAEQAARGNEPNPGDPARLTENKQPAQNESRGAPPLSTAPRATIGFANGRRLHLFTGPNLRFGRHGDGDVLLVSIQNGQVQTSGVNREISRKHFEIKVDGSNVNVMDGWSDDGRPSQHGVCVDGRRVVPGGVLLRPGMLISVTTRSPGGAVPHWKVSLLSSATGLPVATAITEVGAVFLNRLDDAPDDVLVLLTKAAFSAMDVSGLTPEGTLLIRQGGGFAWKIDDLVEPLTMGPTRFPGLSVISVGWCSPTVALPQI